MSIEYSISLNLLSVHQNNLNLDIEHLFLLTLMLKMTSHINIQKQSLKESEATYFWFSPKMIIDTAPILVNSIGIETKDAKNNKSRKIKRQFEYLEANGFIESHRDNQKMAKSYYCMTEKAMFLQQYTEQQSEEFNLYKKVYSGEKTTDLHKTYTENCIVPIQKSVHHYTKNCIVPIQKSVHKPNTNNQTKNPNKKTSSSPSPKEEEIFFEKKEEIQMTKSDTCIKESGTAAAARTLEDCRKVIASWALENKQEVEMIKAQAQWVGTKDEGREAITAATNFWYGSVKHSEAFKSDPVAIFKKYYKVWLLNRKTKINAGESVMPVSRTLRNVEHAIKVRYPDAHEDFTNKHYNELMKPLTDNQFDDKLAAMAKKILSQYANH